MKRLLLLAVVLLIATAALADVAERDVLITPDGTVYSIAGEPSEDGLTSSLVLNIQPFGEKEIRTIIPETINSGVNALPTLAWEASSKSLFVFWMRMPSSGSSELLVTRYAQDKWEPATVIDSKPVLHSHLAIGFTRQVQNLQRDGSFAPTPALILHTAWWEKNGSSESAHYAVMPLSRSWDQQPDAHDMTEFVDSANTTRTPEETDSTDAEFLHHVAIVNGPTPDSVDVIYADKHTNSFYRTTLRPIADARVRIPVGVHGGPKLGTPKALSFDWSGRTSTITSPDGKTVIFCNVTDEKVAWVTLRDGEWLPKKEIALSDKVTVNAAMSALTKMAASSE
jgi:hypothetical protein